MRGLGGADRCPTIHFTLASDSKNTHIPAQVSNKRSQTNDINVCEETQFNTNINLWKVDAEVDGIREEAIVHLFFTV